MASPTEVSQEAARGGIREPQPHPDESVSENLVSGEEEDASGEVQGTEKQPPGDDEDDDAPASMERLVEDLKEKPESGDQDASGEVQETEKQPQGADEVQGTQKEPHDTDEVPATQKQPQDDDEVPETQNQPPGDDEDDDAPASMERLVEDLKEKPESGDQDASGEVQEAEKQPQGADEVQGTQNEPHDTDEVPGAQNQPPGDDEDEDHPAWMEQLEYIDVGGGHMMERDAYDYIRFDMKMFTPNYGQPLGMWPLDDSSTPQDAPPSPPPPE